MSDDATMRGAAEADRPCDEVVDGPDFEVIGENARRLRIVNRKGLHARASAKFVQTVERFSAEVSVSRCGETVGGRSIMGLLTLAAAKGTTIDVEARGAQAPEALDALTALIADRFGEEE